MGNPGLCTFSSPPRASSCRKSRTASKIERDSTVCPVWLRPKIFLTRFLPFRPFLAPLLRYRPGLADVATRQADLELRTCCATERMDQ